MPEIGEIKKGKDVGKPTFACLIWLACEICGKQRWVNLYKMSIRCNHCTRIGIPRARLEKSWHWKGGWINKHGYRLIKLSPEDFFFPMAQKSGDVLEHRLVMAKHLGRCLQSWELVHHKRGVAKNDNRIEGLQLVSDERHQQITILERRIAYLESRVTLLEVENTVLRKEISIIAVNAR